MDSNNEDSRTPYEIYRDAHVEIDRIEENIKMNPPSRALEPSPFGESMPKHFTPNESYTLEVLRYWQKDLVKQRDMSLERHFKNESTEKRALKLKEFERQYEKEKPKAFHKSQEYMYEKLEEKNSKKYIGAKLKDLDMSQEYMLSKMDKSKSLDDKEPEPGNGGGTPPATNRAEGPTHNEPGNDDDFSFSDKSILQKARAGIEREIASKDKGKDKGVDMDRD